MTIAMTNKALKSAAPHSVSDVQCEIENKLFKMADLKAVREIPFTDLVEQVDHVVSELVVKFAYDLTDSAKKRLVDVIAENLVKKSRLVAA